MKLEDLSGRSIIYEDGTAGRFIYGAAGTSYFLCDRFNGGEPRGGPRQYGFSGSWAVDNREIKIEDNCLRCNAGRVRVDFPLAKTSHHLASKDKVITDYHLKDVTFTYRNNTYEGKIFVNDREVFLFQNLLEGACPFEVSPRDLGYKYSYWINNSDTSFSDLKIQGHPLTLVDKSTTKSVIIEEPIKKEKPTTIYDVIDGQFKTKDKVFPCKIFAPQNIYHIFIFSDYKVLDGAIPESLGYAIKPQDYGFRYSFTIPKGIFKTIHGEVIFSRKAQEADLLTEPAKLIDTEVFNIPLI